MKFYLPSSNFFLVLAFLTFANPLFGFCPKPIEEKIVTGSAGAAGANGISGNPAQDGAAGGVGGFAEAITLTGNVRSIATGGAGGKGGNGGNGIGVSFVDGGYGGTGGTGGLARAIAESPTGGTAFARAVGGQGGNGGLGGFGAGGGLDGFGGYGGYGGNAEARAIGLNSAIATAYGGTSGASGGTPFSNSLRGGTAFATARALNAARAVNVIARQYGGDGGISGGAGANSVMVNAVSGGGTAMNFEQSAYAGDGGNGTDGVGGVAGNARSFIDTADLNSVGDSVTGSLTSIGGDGGSSEQAFYNAGKGGNARVGFSSSEKNISINAIAAGGDGGSHLSSGLSGNGGIAVMDYSTISTVSGSNVSFWANLTGGNGGNAFGTTKVGQSKGGDANSLTAVHTTPISGLANSINLSVTLQGGDAGSFGDISSKDRYVGLAGNAFGRMADTTNANLKVLVATTNGGTGANFVKQDPFSTLDWAGGNGGKAESKVYSLNGVGSSHAIANATGGAIGDGGVQLLSPLGFLGFGGAAQASAYAQSNSLSGDVSALSTSIGGRGLNIPSLNGGGGAKSNATAVGTNNNSASADASAKSENSSDGSKAVAVSRSVGGNSEANAFADGRFVGNDLDVLGSTSTSFAQSDSNLANSVANSEAYSGNLQAALSNAKATGRNSTAISRAVGGDTHWSLDGIRGGAANAFATSTSPSGLPILPGSPNTDTIATARAFGGNVNPATGILGIGGNAKASATGTSHSSIDGHVEVLSNAVAGNGSNSLSGDGRAGRADAFATAVMAADEGTASATAVSNTTFVGNSVARATAGKTAQSVAEISGGGGGYLQSYSTSFKAENAISYSTSRFVGPSSTSGASRGSVLSEAKTSGNNVLSATSRVTGIIDVIDQSITNFGTAQAAIAHHQTGNDLGIAPESGSAFVAQEILPGAAYSGAVLEDNASVADNFTNVLGFGTFGNTVGLDTTFTANVAMSLDVAGTGDLLVGFFDSDSVGIGFDFMRFQIMLEGATVVDQSFADLAAANAFFDEQVISLGSFSSISGPLDLELNWMMNTNSTASFQTGIVFGDGALAGPSFFSSVPEPGSLGILSLVGGLLLFRRRRTT